MAKKKETKMNKEEKLPFGRTVANDWYALKLGTQISIVMVINVFLRTLEGYFEWVFFDGIFMRKIVGGLDSGESFKSIITFILLTGVLFGLLALYCAYADNVIFPLEQTKLYGGLYSKIYKKAANVDLKCYEDPDFYNKYTMAIDRSDEQVAGVINQFFGVIVGAVASAYVFKLMFDIDHWSVLFILSPLVGNFIFGNLKNKAEYKRYKEQAPNEKVMNYVSRMMYLPDGAKEIRLTKIFSVMRRQYHDATDKNVKIAQKYAFKNASLNFFRITFTFTVIFEGVLFYASYCHAVKKSISLADLTIMTSLMVAMTWILIDLFEDIMNLMKSGVFINNLRGFLEYKEAIPEDSDGEEPSMEFESLEFRNVSFSYKDELTIKNLSFTIKKGEVAALVGHNGAGKTTIIKLMLRLYDPTEGEIYYNGKNIKEYNLRKYRDIFATVFQDFALFGMTVKENVLMGRHMENEDEKVIEALRRAGVYDKIMTLKDGINTMMTKEFDENGAVLSGGESQKVAVARTFLKESPLKIFDEPSSALDPIAEYDLFKNIMAEGASHTMLFISHRLSSVKNCDKVFMLENGTLIEEGTHKELMELDGKYAKMYRRQAMNYLALNDEKEVVL